MRWIESLNNIASEKFLSLTIYFDPYKSIIGLKSLNLLPTTNKVLLYNNREFKLISHECRQFFLYAFKKAIDKFKFKLYALCIISNHVHYLIEPALPKDLPRIMHWLNWYAAMCFNRMLNRCGHFWEKRYHSSGFDKKDYKRALNTLRYIHANPKAAKVAHRFFLRFQQLWCSRVATRIP